MSETTNELRDRYAGYALIGLLTRVPYGTKINKSDMTVLAGSAFVFADEMMAAAYPEHVAPAPPSPEVPALPWPLPPHLRVPRLVGDVGQFVRSTGTDDKGNYYEDFYDDHPVFRDNQGYFQIDDGAVHVSYLNLPGASIEHRIVPRPSAGASLENAP